MKDIVFTYQGQTRQLRVPTNYNAESLQALVQNVFGIAGDVFGYQEKDSRIFVAPSQLVSQVQSNRPCDYIYEVLAKEEESNFPMPEQTPSFNNFFQDQRPNPDQPQSRNPLHQTRTMPDSQPMGRPDNSPMNPDGFPFFEQQRNSRPSTANNQSNPFAEPPHQFGFLPDSMQPFENSSPPGGMAPHSDFGRSSSALMEDNIISLIETLDVRSGITEEDKMMLISKVHEYDHGIIGAFRCYQNDHDLSAFVNRALARINKPQQHRAPNTPRLWANIGNTQPPQQNYGRARTPTTGFRSAGPPANSESASRLIHQMEAAGIINDESAHMVRNMMTEGSPSNGFAYYNEPRLDSFHPEDRTLI